MGLVPNAIKSWDERVDGTIGFCNGWADLSRSCLLFDSLLNGGLAEFWYVSIFNTFARSGGPLLISKMTFSTPSAP